MANFPIGLRSLHQLNGRKNNLEERVGSLELYHNLKPESDSGLGEKEKQRGSNESSHIT